jgi:hypothetical protein
MAARCLPLWGFPSFPLVFTLDTPMGVLRIQPRVVPRVGSLQVSLTWVLEGGYRTLTEA